jgi:hypothetical protein
MLHNLPLAAALDQDVLLTGLDDLPTGRPGRVDVEHRDRPG